MNEYRSHTPAAIKDYWQTPIAVFNALDREFGFYLDVAANAENALCSRFLSEQDDALSRDWNSEGAIWCNPPYSNIKPWVEKAAQQYQIQRQAVVMLIPADTSVGWFSLACQSVDEVRFITDGRLSFISAATGSVVNGNTKGSMLLIWRPFIRPRCQFTSVSRDALISISSTTPLRKSA